MKLCVKDSLRIFEDFENTETAIERCSRVVVLQKTVMQFSSSILVINYLTIFKNVASLQHATVFI